MAFILTIVILTIMILYAKNFLFFIEKKDFSIAEALGAAAVAWIKDVPELIKNIIKGIKAGIDFIKGGNN